MEFNADQLLDKLSEVIKSEVKTETIIGEPFTLGEFTCVPVVKAGIGFGTGGGNGEAPDNKGKGTGGGAGAGLGLAPVGFLVTKGDEISFINTEKTSGLGKAFEKVPDLIAKLMEKKSTVESTY